MPPVVDGRGGPRPDARQAWPPSHGPRHQAWGAPAGGPHEAEGAVPAAAESTAVLPPVAAHHPPPGRGGPGGPGPGRERPAGEHGQGRAPAPEGQGAAAGDRRRAPGSPEDPAAGDPGPAAPGQGDPAPAAPRPRKAGRNLPAAIGVGVGLGAVIIASLFVFKVLFVGVVVIAVVVGLWELTTRLAERKQINVPLVPLAVGGTAMIVAGYVRGAEGAWVAMGLTALALLVWRMTDPPEDYLRDVTAGVFATFYVPFLATFVALMLAESDGAARVVTFLLLTVCSDTGAYAVGYRFGKHKLAPRISPGKTREGLLGAIGLSMAAGALCLQFAVDGTWWQGLLMGLAVAISATLGDLGESMIKRDLGIKDMGTLLPGHGGIMDRLDSLLPTAPVAWLLFAVFL
ncbi:hypothetical protein GCM10027168_55950 [Streptomyces capparidis]